MSIFINFSNHPSRNWSDEQIKAVHDIAENIEIADIPFPDVNSSADENEIYGIAEDNVKKIISYSPAAVLCQGEFGVTFHVVTRLKEMGVRVLYACSERITTEIQTENGTEKVSRFCFVRFRNY